MYVDLKEAVKKYRSSITALQDRTKRKIPVLRAAVEEVREVTYALRERVEVVRNTIRDTIQNHIRALQEQERELIGQLEDISNSKEKVGCIVVHYNLDGYRNSLHYNGTYLHCQVYIVIVNFKTSTFTVMGQLGEYSLGN